MPFITVIKRQHDGLRKSDLRFGRTGNTVEELVESLIDVPSGRVDIYDLDTLVRCATIFSSGHVLYRTEYENERVS